MESLPFDIRVGQGIDLHQFASRPFVEEDPEGLSHFVTIGGVAIPHTHRLVGHSDADVMLHALMDSLLGAAGLPDIGHFFPNTDPQYQGISSVELLERVLGEVQKENWRVINVDITVVCETPKIAPHLSKMKHLIGQALGVESSVIGIKATTAETLGAIGRGEGIYASCVCLLTRSRSRN